jgi:hypothetical protein
VRRVEQQQNTQLCSFELSWEAQSQQRCSMSHLSICARASAVMPNATIYTCAIGPVWCTHLRSQLVLRYVSYHSCKRIHARDYCSVSSSSNVLSASRSLPCSVQALTNAGMHEQRLPRVSLLASFVLVLGGLCLPREP